MINIKLKLFINLCSTKTLFKHLKHKYTAQQIQELNKLISLKFKLCSLQTNGTFLQKCLLSRVVPNFILKRINKSKLRHSISIERVFIKSEIANNQHLIEQTVKAYDSKLSSARIWLSFLDLIRVLRYSTNLIKAARARQTAKLDKWVLLLHRNRFGNKTPPSSNNIINLSDHVLSDDERFVLSHGLSFNIPPKSLNREETLAEFEVLAGQLKHHTPKSQDEVAKLRTKLADLALGYHATPIDRSDFTIRKDFFKILRNIKTLNNIVITKPDKGAGVVIRNKEDYLLKMKEILKDTTKFKHIGPVHTNDNTAGIENKLRRTLSKLLKGKMLTQSEYDQIRPVGSLRPRLYGLPKTHKANIPLRPILSMIGSTQHKLAQWLAKLLMPVAEKYGKYTVKDSFSFAETMRSFDNGMGESFMCSFDIKSLFTNVPLRETIKICTDALYGSSQPPSRLPKQKFRELLEFATLNVEFSFNYEMYQQTDGVAMGSPLGPILANIFVGAMEEKLFSQTTKPPVYFRYVDDVFAVFNNKQESVELYHRLNQLHQSLKFTTENESDNCLAFLDVLVSRENGRFTTTVYRKPTFRGLYVRWDSFCCKRRKLNLISTLVSRAVNICSPSKLNSELDNITNILSSNGYPPNTIRYIMHRTLDRLKSPKQPGPHKCPVQIHLPYIGKVSEVFEQRLKSAVDGCFGSVKLRVLFTAKRLWSASLKDKLPITSTNNNVYKFLCQCGDWYIGKSTQRLQTRIEQHVPSFIRLRNPITGSPKKKKKSNPSNGSPKKKRKKTTTANKIKLKTKKKRKITVAPPRSAIDEHLRTHVECAAAYEDQWFSIISRGRNSFHLSVLESMHISSTSPPLCRMKKFVYKSSLFFDRYCC